MAEQSMPIVLPELGTSGLPITFGQWLVDEGDWVLQGDRVAEVLTGSVLFHVSSPGEGMLRHVTRSEGTVLQPGRVLGYVESSGRNG